NAAGEVVGVSDPAGAVPDPFPRAFWWTAESDVGPKARQPTLENRGSNGQLFLTLPGVLVRCQMAERAVRPALIVIDPPRFDLGPGGLDRRELMHVQTLVAKAPVEGLNKGVLHRFSRPDEIQLH